MSGSFESCVLCRYRSLLAVRSLVYGSPNECVCVIKCDQVPQQRSTPTVSGHKDAQESKKESIDMVITLAHTV